MTDGHPIRSEGRMERLGRNRDSVWTLAELYLLEKLVQRQVDA